MDNMDLVEILELVYPKLVKEITDAYYDKTVDKVLEKYGFKEEAKHLYFNINRSKILVIGDSQVGKDELTRVAKSYGIKPDQIEFIFEYDKFTNFDYGRLEGNMTYSDILIGPIPHKGKGIEKASSFLALVKEHPENYPKVIQLRGSNELKITKQSFINGLLETRLYRER